MAIDGVYGELDTEATHEASSRSDTSEYQSQPPFPEFVCGCQKCSIKDYLHMGCPLAGKVENYPKLDIKGLSLDDQEIILNRLDLETQNVQLVKIIDEFGSEDDKRKLRDYENQTLIPFLQRSIIQIPSTAFRNTKLQKTHLQEWNCYGKSHWR